MIFAKLKSTPQNTQNHRILASDPANVRSFSFYEAPTIHNQAGFNPEVQLDNNEWYFVRLSSEQVTAMIQPYLASQTSSGDLNNAAATEYQDIVCVYRIFTGRKVIFTKITPSFKVSSRKLLRLYDTAQAEIYEEKNSIVFDGKIDAYFDGNNKLYFKKFDRLPSLFPGIREFHRLATEEEKREFLAIELFYVDGLQPENIGPKYSKKIAKVIANDTLALASGIRDAVIIAAVQAHPTLGIKLTPDNKILLKDPADLAPVLKIITGNYFTSEITGEELEAVGILSLSDRT